MKIAVIGATGWIGSTIVGEALAQGHQVIAISREVVPTDNSNVVVRPLDLLATMGLKEAVLGADIVISAIGGRAAGNHEIVVNTAQRLLDELPQLGIARLLWVGGAGSLITSSGESLLSSPNFPPEHKDEAIAQGQALDVFKNTRSELDWVFVSPAAQIFLGERTGTYRVGGDQLLLDTQGNSTISVQDYAKALVDEAQNSVYHRQRIGIAY
ncbi:MULTISPECIES: NAD(P)-dependent oxidoreductase [Pseudoalteromonas]|uniref:NAD-dependent dehydratase n=1 Tax=Pseudoalteromonas amylolytica TaxID=1859457 RepID=A0A1S1N016_9GAMM|nr:MULTISPECIES: NAD(P)H-binding protein [Pseudoalteromonas]OHU89023.1 NAD-dependent dehydratase [Pseudoalteromonas sp. JW3]OHU91923.1 NAD-dependent dehydratase [Pseudoalteromonas amylolytica]